MAKVGKKPRLEAEPELAKGIVKLLEKGMPRVHACAQFRVSEKTFYNWMLKYREALESGDKDSVYFQFGQSVKEAESHFIERNLSVIQVASIKSWQAAAWLLERRFGNDFGRFQKVMKTDTSSNDPVDSMSDDEVQKALNEEQARIARRARPKHFKAV